MMTIATMNSESWRAAQAEGLSFFRAQMHVGHSTQFVGHSWEDGGFSVDESGEPKCDAKGNTVAVSRVEQLDPTDASHVAQVEEWYG